MPTLADIVSDLGFILAIDNCARGCAHCPAYGSRDPVQRADFAELTARVQAIAAVRVRLGLPVPQRVVHCWRISDPLDYRSRRPDGGAANCADIARLWHTELGQGLYVVTNGSEHRSTARRALTELVANPHLVSQIKLTITHADRAWGTRHYLTGLATDVAALAPLWQMNSTRAEDRGGRRFRINVKSTPPRRTEAYSFVLAVLIAAGFSPAEARAACDDPTRVRFKPIYDLGTADGRPSSVDGAVDIRDASGGPYKPTGHTRQRRQYGIRPDGRLFVVDMYAFTERDLHGPAGPLLWPRDIEAVDPFANLDAGSRALTDA